MQSEKILESLMEKTKQIITKVEPLKEYDLQTLTWRENRDSWTILEYLEHLNLYGEYYLPEFGYCIKNSKNKNDEYFKSGYLGNYFCITMLPKGKINKMKTFKSKNPIDLKLDKIVIDNFINQQIIFLELLNQARYVSLNKTKVKISISRFIRLKLGDTLQFYCNHIIRHINQIEKIEFEMKNVNT
jgi:hypothetical protein